MRIYSVYILTNHTNSVLYVGVTSDLFIRLNKHNYGHYINSFTKRYRLYKLVWLQDFQDINDALAAEKKIKGWKREKKLALVKEINPELKDLGR